MSALIAACLTLTAAATVSGAVVDAAGAPVPHAQVFLEPSLAAPLEAAQADANGRFQLPVEGPATVGIFAYAEGHAFGGVTRTLAVDEALDGVTLRLGEPASVTGRVRSAVRGEALEGARIIGVALLGHEKVSIHFPKLRDHGFGLPATGSDGRFSVGQLPSGTPLALKITHPLHAQEGVTDITAGGAPVEVQMYPGVMLRGEAVTRIQRDPVANVVISFANAQPPHDTALTRTDAQGSFSLRLKPGVYLYRAESSRFRSPSWRRLTLRGDTSTQRTTLYVSEVATITGEIRDAVSGEPVEGARLTLRADGTIAGTTTTGPTGRYHFDAAAGTSDLILETAPGFRPPERTAQSVTVSEGQDFTMPDMWLAPIPDMAVTFVTQSGDPAPGVLARVLEPSQIGWHIADDEGRARLRVANLPASGNILAVAEEPDTARAALFSLSAGDGATGRVEMLPCEPITGRVVDERGRALSTAIVGLLMASPNQDAPHLLWRTLTDGEGRFRIERGLPGAALRCIAFAGDDETGEPRTGESASFVLEQGDGHDTGNIVVSGGRAGASMLDKRIRFRSMPVICGELPPPSAEGRPIMLTYCSAAEAEVVRDRLAADYPAWQDAGYEVLLAVDGDAACGDAPFAILRGEAPGTATTYLLDARGRVTAETMGLTAVRRLAGASAAR